MLAAWSLPSKHGFLRRTEFISPAASSLYRKRRCAARGHCSIHCWPLPASFFSSPAPTLPICCWYEGPGAARRTIFRQLLTESLMLAAIGGALGVAFSSLLVPVARAALPDSLPRLNENAVPW